MDHSTPSQLAYQTINPNKTRHVTFLAHIDHGQSTLKEALIAKLPKVAQSQTNTTQTEESKQQYRKPPVTTLYYEYPRTQTDTNRKELHLINVIENSTVGSDNSDLSPFLKIADGAVVIVDAVEGLPVAAEQLLRQASKEVVKPVLMINKLDRLFLELQMDPEDMYQKLCHIIDQTNTVLSTHKQYGIEETVLDPGLGNVAFGSAKQQWGFTLTKFAEMYAEKFQIPKAQLAKKLWGDHYFDQEAKKWVNEPISANGKPLQRGFVQFILRPITMLMQAILQGNNEQIDKILTKIEINLEATQRELTDKPLIKAVFSQWLNIAECILEMVIIHLPSPHTAQTYRTNYIYKGPLDEPCGMGIKNCNPYGPLMIYISSLRRTSDPRKFTGFGRVFSGTIKSGQEVRILGPEYKRRRKEDLFVSNVNNFGVIVGKNFEAKDIVTCGSLIWIDEIDQFLSKSGTISDSEDAYLFQVRKYAQVLKWRVAIAPMNPADLPKFIEGLRKVGKPEPLIDIYQENTGQYYIEGISELHVEVTLRDLEKSINCKIKAEEPLIAYRETVTEASSRTCVAKSANKQSVMYCNAQPLEEELCVLIEKDEIYLNRNSNRLVEEFGWDKEDVVKIWTFGVDDANILVNQTKDIPKINEAKDSMVSAFEWVVQEGVLAGENLRKIRINILDANLETPIHSAQITACARRVYQACQLASKPTLQEPIDMVNITVPPSLIGVVYQFVNQRKGQVFDEQPLEGSPLAVVKAYLPVSESKGLAGQLRGLTNGQAFPQVEFGYWSDIEGDVFDENSKVWEVVKNLRKRKGLKEEIPNLSDYIDDV